MKPLTRQLNLPQIRLNKVLTLTYNFISDVDEETCTSSDVSLTVFHSEVNYVLVKVRHDSADFNQVAMHHFYEIFCRQLVNFL